MGMYIDFHINKQCGKCEYDSPDRCLFANKTYGRNVHGVEEYMQLCNPRLIKTAIHRGVVTDDPIKGLIMVDQKRYSKLVSKFFHYK